jgi:23S rRNA pseudouridine2605 synthase
VASRRAGEELIVNGRVTVNGRRVTKLGTRVDPFHDRVEVDGRRVATDPRKVYIVLNKPRGVVSTARDDRGRHTVVALVESETRVYPVGRLDADSQGVLLLTNDGPLANRLAHPRYGVPKTYRVEVEGTVSPRIAERLRAGMKLEDGIASALSARVIETAKGRSHVELVMGEGRKHEVKRMLAATGHPVRSLVRKAFGPIRAGSLKPGEWRYLTLDEIATLYQLVDL